MTVGNIVELPDVRDIRTLVALLNERLRAIGETLGRPAALTADLDAGGHRITNLGEPRGGSDAASVFAVERRLPRTQPPQPDETPLKREIESLAASLEGVVDKIAWLTQRCGENSGGWFEEVYAGGTGEGDARVTLKDDALGGLVEVADTGSVTKASLSAPGYGGLILYDQNGYAVVRGDANTAATYALVVGMGKSLIVGGDLHGLAGLKMDNLPSSSPGAGSKKLWYDPADGNRVKFAV